MAFYILALVAPCLLAQQYFRVKPHDTSVVAGRTAELHCHVGNRAGLVQWSKDGFLLGYDPEIPGYERYEMRVDHSKSAYTLLVHQARLEDEGEFQCQVGPIKNEKPIRSVARLTVLVPPKSLLINGLGNNSDLEVREAEKVILECQALSSKPATILKWYRKNIELMPEASKTSVRREGEKLYTTVSSITLYPKGEATGVPYSCEAVHPGLEKPVKNTISVQVLYPPSPPTIEGYRDGDVIQAGDRLTLICISKGGKPPARLVWYKNGEVLEGTYSSVGKDASNMLSFVAVPTDNNAIYACAAVNPLTPRPLLKTAKISVLFPPTKVFMNGPKEAHRGEAVTVICRTDASNPPATINWRVDGKAAEPYEANTSMDESGWYATSKVLATISRQETKMKVFECHAMGVPPHEAVFQSFNVTIIYPPENPKIEGYVRGQDLRAGRRHQFTCSAVAGHPPAEIRWYKGSSEIPSNTTVNGSLVQSMLNIQIEAFDNGNKLRCEVNNSAVTGSLGKEVQLRVLFAPSNISISIQPTYPKEGETAKLECMVSSSNPASKVVWWQNGRLLPGHQARNFESTFGGWSTKSTLLLRPLTAQDDLSKITCEAKTESFEESVKERITIRVRYAPVFVIVDKVIEVIEGQSGEYNVSARAHPDIYRYSWSKDGKRIPRQSENLQKIPRVTSEGATLYYNKTMRQDAGVYVCTAENTEGSSNAAFTLNVLYPAIVANITGQPEVAEGEILTLECLADGNPLTESTISWRKKDSLQPLPATSSEIGRSILTLLNSSRSMSGIVECVTDNGVGSPSISSIPISIMYRPYVLRNDLKLRVAVGERHSAEMSCGAEGHPEVSFTWSYNGTTLATGQLESQKYLVRVTKRKEREYWSTLYIKAIDWTDFGIYTCVAGNTQGHDFITFALARTGVPDRPLAVQGMNVTHNSVLLIWTPGFDGGMPQTFRLRFRDVRDSNYTFLEAPYNSSSIFVRNLRQGTIYEFALASKNQLGDSAFSPVLRIRTKNLPVMDSTVSHLDSEGSTSAFLPTWLLAAAIAGSFVVLINLLLCIMYVRKKQWCQGTAMVPGPELVPDGDDVSEEKKIVKKKIPCGLEEDSPPFYLSGTTVDLPEDALDLSSFQKPPNLGKLSNESSEDGQSSGERRCDCGGRPWGNTLICGSGSPGQIRSMEYEHKQCPDILKRDSCQCHVASIPGQRVLRREGKHAASITASVFGPSSEIADSCLYSTNQSPSQMVLTTFQSKSELPIRHSLLDVIGPKLETIINGDGEDS